MPLMPFSLPRHILLLIDGRKVQTTRQPRKRPLKVGDVLYCYYKPRQKKSCLNCITMCQTLRIRRESHPDISCLPEDVLPCDDWTNYFGEAVITKIEQFSKLPGPHPAVLGLQTIEKKEEWAKLDGFKGWWEASDYFERSTKNEDWMFKDWDVITFEPKWIKQEATV